MSCRRRKRCSVVQWNPEVATQLMVASDDDQSPSLQLWDLRNSVSPIREYHGHAKARAPGWLAALAAHCACLGLQPASEAWM